MRHILVDHARRKQSEKRGGDLTRITLSESLGTPENDRLDVVVLDEAMTRLEAIYPQQSRIVELRFFAGLTMPEVAQALGISLATAERRCSSCARSAASPGPRRPTKPPSTPPSPRHSPCKWSSRISADRAATCR